MSTDTGSRLAALRRERGLSQEELAAQTGVSRQAVSNWERSESLPDTANLLRLSQLYGVSIDDLLGNGPSTDEMPPAASASAAGMLARPRVRRIIALAACAVFSAVWYWFLAQPLLLSTINDVSEMFGLAVGPTLAMVWFAAEVAFVIAPFVLVAAARDRLPRQTWIMPLAVFAVPMLAVAGIASLGGSPLNEYSGLGGALMPSIAIKADILALALGCVLARIAGRPRSAVPSAQLSGRREYT